MTREEIENDIINTLFECTHSGEDDTISDKEFAEVLADKFINHEIDLLKEFVEWQAKQYKDLYYKYDKEMKEVKDDTDYFWCSGRVAGIGEIRRHLKKDIKRFLEEHNGKQD